MLRLYDEKTGSVEEIRTARPGVLRVSCAGELRSLLVGDLIRRTADHHGLQTIGVWADVPGAERVAALDLAIDVPAIRDCLAEGNPTTDSDPARVGEAGWWGVREGGRLVGVIGAALRGGASDTGFSWHLHGLGVRPEVRRGGLGTALLVAAANAGLSSGADWVSLGVWADNEPALRIYRRLGWRTDARMRSYRPAEHPANRTPR